MLEPLLAALEASALAREVRQSVWIYPAANVAHIIGLMFFFASVAAMDVMALLARYTVRELRYFGARVRPVALSAFAVQVGTGVLMFLPEATHVAHNPAFQIKILAIILALVNALGFLWVLGKENAQVVKLPGVKMMAALSLVLWIGVAALGRLIAYF